MSTSTTVSNSNAGKFTTTRMVVTITVALAVYAAIAFLAAGTLRWWEGWAFLGVTAAYTVTASIMVPRDEELYEERTSIKEDAKTWDKVIASILSLLMTIGFLVFGGLDVRFGWSPALPLWLEIASLALVLGSLLFMMWPAMVNRFYTRYVRIQTERGHHVVKTGPYRLVRHPAYAGFLIYSLVSATALGSLWSLILSAIMMVLMVIRTALEDNTLRAELPGYEDYTHETRYRLIPGIW